MARALGVETLVVHRPSSTLDRFGDPTSTEPDREVEGCAIVPRPAAGEDADPRSMTVIAGLQAFCPPDADIRATDQVTVRGRRYEVDGEPGDFRARRTGASKVLLVNLKRVTG